MEFEHEKFGKCELADVTQEQLEKFHEAMKGKGDLSLTQWRGDSVRNFAKLGLILEPKLKPEDVGGMKPGHVYWISECIAKCQAEALNIDPLS